MLILLTYYMNIAKLKKKKNNNNNNNDNNSWPELARSRFPSVIVNEQLNY